MIGIGIGIPFMRGGGGIITLSAPSGLTVTTQSTTEIIASVVNNESTIDGYSWEYSTDGITYLVHGTGVSNSYSYDSLTDATGYYFRVRVYSGAIYSDYSNIEFAATYNSALIAGWNFDDSAALSRLTEYAIHSLSSESAIYYNGRTYIVYKGVQTDGDPYITYYTHATGLWATPVLIADNPLLNDIHGAPGMIIDNSGYIHVIFGCHETAIKYCRSDNPEDISAWTAMPDIDSTGTYTQLVLFSTGVICLFYRLTSVTDDWGYRTSNDGGDTWSAYTSIMIDFAYCKFTKGVGDTVHCSINGNNVTGFTRYNVYYIYFDGTNWKNAAGTTLSTPLDITDAPDILVHNSGTNYIPNTIVIADSSNNPFIVFSESETAAEISTYNYKFAKYSGVWNIINIGPYTDVFQDFISALDVKSDTNFDTYLLFGGNTGAVGGHVQKWSTTDAGDTWTFVENIINEQCWSPILVKDYNNNARLIIPQIKNSVNYILNVGYLWGDGGFIVNTNLPYTFLDIKRTYPIAVSGAVTLVSGKYSSGVSISTGSGNNLLLLDQDIFSFNGGSPDKPFTFTVWVNLSSTNSLGYIFYKRGTGKHEYSFCITANTIQLLCLKNDATAYILATAPFTTTDSWVFLCGTYNGSGLATGLKIYIDCIESQNSQTETGTYTGMGNYAGNINIGSSAVAYLRNFDELKMFNKILTPTEMAKVMANTAGW